MLQALAKDVLDGTAAWDPAWASTEGLRAYDERLADPSPEAVAKRVRALETWRRRADTVEDDADPLDLAALRFTLDVEAFQLTRVRTHERNPDLAGEFMNHLLPLLLRRDAPPAEKAAAIGARLAGASDFLARGRRRVDAARVPPLWVEVARETVEHAPAFLEAVTAAVADAPEEVRSRVAAAATDARDALTAHAEWLEHDVAPQAAGEWALGTETFNDLLAVRGIDRDADALWTLGHDVVARFREDTRNAAGLVLASEGKQAGHDVVRDALAVVASDHPATFAEVLEAYRGAIAASRRFTSDNAVATVPDVPVDVVETPTYLRHLVPFAAYIQPGRFDAKPRGTYLVTPKVDLAAFPRADVRNTTVHEAFPGHHLQLSVSREVPSLARFLVREHAPEMLEGWALYCEEIMGRHGFTAGPAERLVRAKDALWRAVRVVLDVGLHTGRLGFDEAVGTLMRETGMTPEEAAAEVKRYTLTPTYNLSYMYGRLRFEEARVRAEAEPDFEERAWHDALLRQGSLPLHLLLARA